MAADSHSRHRICPGTIIFLVTVVLFLAAPGGALAAPPLSPYVIANDATGGECLLIGTWDNASKTCTLTADIDYSPYSSHAIDIQGNGITLDGNGHTVNGKAGFYGVLASGRSNVSIRRINLTNFTYGVLIDGLLPNNITIISNSFSGNSTSVLAIGLTSAQIIDNDFIPAPGGAGISLDSSTFVQIRSNQITFAETGILLHNSDLNTINGNKIFANTDNGIWIRTGSDLNTVTNNDMYGQDLTSPIGLYLLDASANTMYGNSFLNNTAQALVASGIGNSFNQLAPAGGNYWDDFALPADGCANTNGDRFCDSAYSGGGAVDSLPLARRSYYFTWYDQLTPGVQDWVLMTNPSDPAADPGADAWFDLSIGGIEQIVPSSMMLSMPGRVLPMAGTTPTYPGVMSGPVQVSYHADIKQMVSQRILWGDSLEEVTGTDEARLSSDYHWSWYDNATPGFTNWIMIANPTADTVRALIWIDGVQRTNTDTGLAYFDIPPGGRITPKFPGVIGGPVEVRADIAGTSTPANVIASQRVLSNYGAAFNEVPGIPDSELGPRYIWTWYDMVSPGAQNWVLVGNPLAASASIFYDVTIGGLPAGSGGPILPGDSAFALFPGTQDGPVVVRTFTDPTNETTKMATLAESVVSQRSLWGPSFEEMPGQNMLMLDNTYNWTWYDMVSPGAQNWVMVAHPSPDPPFASFQIKIGGTLMDLDPLTPGQQDGFVYPGDVTTYVFPGTIGGPVQIISDNNVIASQRVLWKGHFNEVSGTDLD